MEEKKQLRKINIKRLNWRIKVLLSIFTAVISIVILLFGITYFYFEDKFEDNTKKIAEDTLNRLIKSLKIC